MSALGASLNYKLTSLLLLVLVVTSLVFLLLFYATYQYQLRSERSETSRQVSFLLQASLENAMLKRDLPGLQAIVDRLGEQPEILDVSILNTMGEVRFSSHHQHVGDDYSEILGKLCPDCEAERNLSAVTRIQKDLNGNSIFRSMTPVKNRDACIGCHGSPEQRPVNGILIVDYDAEPIISKIRSGILGLLFAGLVVMTITILTIGWFMRRYILQPVSHLRSVSEDLAQGNLSARVDVKGEDEFSELGASFNLMAKRLDASLQQLLEKETYLQALIDAIPDGIRVIDKNFKVINANKAYREQLQLPEDKVTNVSCYQSSHHLDEPCVPTLVTCPVARISEKQEAVKTMQNFINTDGEYSEMQVFAAPLELETEKGQEVFVVESIRDLQRDINFSHEQKLSALGQLAAGVSHEIRNPLSSIRIALQTTLRKLKKQPDAQYEIINYLELVDGEIDKCVAITERMLKMSSLPSEHKEMVNINDAIRDTLSLLDFERIKSNITIHLELDEEIPQTMAAESDIRMLFTNLVQNAFHAMFERGSLAITSKIINDEIKISVKDDGVGISSEYKPHIFEPFFSRRMDGQHGTGLGLTISRSIVERYGGSIQARDIKPRGTEFVVILPLAKMAGQSVVNG